MHFTTSKPYPEWFERLRERKFTNDTVFANPHMEVLKRRLLQYGGYGVVLALPEPHLNEILSRGYIADGKSTILLDGEPSRCHENAYRFWASQRVTNIDLLLCTGWALSDDGLWRQHSWVRYPEGEVIYETTVERVAYFGFDLTEMEARTFV